MFAQALQGRDRVFECGPLQHVALEGRRGLRVVGQAQLAGKIQIHVRHFVARTTRILRASAHIRLEDLVVGEILRRRAAKAPHGRKHALFEVDQRADDVERQDLEIGELHCIILLRVALIS